MGPDAVYGKKQVNQGGCETEPNEAVSLLSEQIYGR